MLRPLDGRRTFDLDGEEPDHRGREREHRSHDPNRAVVALAVQHRSEHRTERQPAVDRDRPVAHRLAAPIGGREVGDHRGRADEEARLTEAGRDAHQHEKPERVDEAVGGSGGRDDQRATDDEHAPTDGVTDAPGEGSQQDGAHCERADRDAHRDAAVPERLLDVVGQHRREHRHRREIAEPARHHEREMRREDPGSGRVHAFASSIAASQLARSAMSFRYCIT